MKRIVSICCAVLILPLTGCMNESADGNQTVFRVDRDARKPDRGGSRYGYGSDQNRGDAGERPANTGVGDTVVTDGTTDGVGSTDVPIEGPDLGDTTPDPGPGSSDPQTPSTPAADAPFAQKVPGQYGLVYSPFAPGKEVSVKGYPPGTLVKCPYTDKEFKVP